MASSCSDLSAHGGPYAGTISREEAIQYWRSHRRTKSAGSNTSRDLSLYTNMGLYSHHVITRLVKTETVTGDFVSLYKTAESSSASTHEVVKVLEKTECLCLDQGAEEDPLDRECGILNLRPQCVQTFARIRIFVFLSCVLVTLQQALSSGYFNSVITTIEKRFDIPSRVLGGIASTFEVGNLLTIIFVSYLGSHRHIPVWIGKGCLIMGVGSLVFSLPYFLDQPSSSYNYVNKHGSNASHFRDGNTCRISPVSVQPVHAELQGGGHFGIQHPGRDLTSSRCSEGSSSSVLHILIFMISQVLIGCGGSPIFTLGTTYIDDHVKKESSSMYIGCMYSTSGLGLVCGFLLGGYLLSIHEDAILYDTVPYDVHPGSPRWVGAWWAGFVLYGVLLMVIAIPFFAFPKTLKKEKERLILESNELSPSNECQIQEELHMPGETQPSHSVSKETEKKQKYGKDVKDIPVSMWHLLTNPVYIVTCLGASMELSIVNGFIIFLPKYLETQFSLGKSEANVFTGGIAIPGACVGIFLGGYLLKRFQLRPKGAIQFMMLFNILSLGLYTVLYFLGCDNIRMAGATLPYFNNTEFDHFQVNLTADCNLGCQCTPYEIEPVCGRNGITYFSPCHAGCRLDNDRIQGIGIIQNFTSCACIPTNKTVLRDVMAVPLATYGSCPQVCKAMIPFMVLLFIMTLVVSIMQMPVLMITLRSVSEEERSFALGMQFVIFRLFGYIPSPIMFGNVIDSTCLVWKAYCGRPSGFCLMHDIEQFRLRYIGVCTGLKVVSGCLFFLDWVLISWKQRKDIEQPVAMTLGELVSSVISMDRHSATGDFIHEDVRMGTLRSDEEMQPLEDDYTGLHPGAERDFIHKDVREGTVHDKEEMQPLENDNIDSHHSSSYNQVKER